MFYVPLSSAASPRNVLMAHLIGALMGWLSLASFGLLNAPPAILAAVDWPRVAAAALSLGGTSCLMILFRLAHAPAGATSLIVSLGLMPRLEQIPILMAAVGLLLGQAFVKAERFIQTSLREWAYARAYDCSEQRTQHLLPWLHHYNWHRPHASLGYKPPISRLPAVNNLLALHRPDWRQPPAPVAYHHCSLGNIRAAAAEQASGITMQAALLDAFYAER